MRCSSHRSPSPAATLSTTTTLKNVQDRDGDHHHPANDFCAQPNDPNQGYFRLSESDKQLLRLLETRNHWKQLRKIFDLNLNFFSYFISSWSIIIAFVKN
jgi:hypothetical protein